MAYLIIDAGISPARKRWMLANAIPISRGVWLHNAVIDGALCARVDDVTLSDLAEPIEVAARKILANAESRIVQGNMRGRSADLLANRLRMVVGLSLDIETIAYAGDLLFALGKSAEPGEKTAEITAPRAKTLGFDKDSVKKYLLSVAKKGPIH